MLPSACVSDSLCFRPLMFPSAYVSVSLRLHPPASTFACTPACLHPQRVALRALFHRSLSHLSGSVCSSRLSCSFLFSPYLFIPLFLFLFFFHFHFHFHFLFTFSSSLIFSLPILLTLLVLPATHPFELKTLYREQISGH